VVQADGGHIQPLFGIGLERDLPGTTMFHLAGYRGIVRCAWATRRRSIFSMTYGNGVGRGAHDLSACCTARGQLNSSGWKPGEQALKTYDQPDAGIVEQHWRACAPHPR
jgi:hypothetical protein